MVIRRSVELSLYMWRKREGGVNWGERFIVAGVCISIMTFEQEIRRGRFWFSNQDGIKDVHFKRGDR